MGARVSQAPRLTWCWHAPCWRPGLPAFQQLGRAPPGLPLWQGQDKHGGWGRGRLLRVSADVLERAASGGAVEVEVGAAEGEEEAGGVALEVEGEAVEVEQVPQVGAWTCDAQQSMQQAVGAGHATLHN